MSMSESQTASAAKPVLQFTNSSPALLHHHGNDPQMALQQAHAEAAVRLHHTRLASMTDRWALSFLFILALLLAWAIGHFQASLALLMLLGVAALAVGRGRWQQVMAGARLAAEFKVRKRNSTNTLLRGENVEWVNFLLNRWWTTCDDSVLTFTKDYIEPLIAELLPPGIDKVEVVQVDFGGQTPVVSNMRISDLNNNKDDSTSTSTLILNFDLAVSAPDCPLVLRARVGGKSVGCNHLVYINSLHLNGPIQAVVVLDSHAPFPNVHKITATFINKPDIWFSVKVLKGLKVTNIPVLKHLIHSVVMDVFTSLLVDPGKLTLNFDPLSSSPLMGYVDDHAVGVVTVTVTAKPPHKGKGEHEGDARRWISLRLGQSKFQEQLSLDGGDKGAWHGVYSFLVYNLQQDVLVLKVKIRRVVYNKTLALHSVSLNSLGLVNDRGEETCGERVLKFSNAEVDVDVKLCYTPLPSFSVNTLNGFPPVSKDTVCGVLSVHVHRGQDLMACDSKGLSDPYCTVHANKRKILCTHHVPSTLAPCWEKGVEIFVADVTQVVLTFLVMDWGGPLAENELLGVAKFTLPKDCSELIQHKLPLVADTATHDQEVALGKLIISVVFRPVASVGMSSHVTGVGVATPLTPRGDVGATKKGRGIKMKPHVQGHVTRGIVELHLVRGRDLVPKDSNGLSDPYIVVKYGTRIMFRSKVVKKSLSPEWNEVATLTAPSPGDAVHVECWDKDLFSDDFMGSVQFTVRDLQIFKEREQWCRLQDVAHGQVLIRLALSEDRMEKLRWSHLDEASRQLVGLGEVSLLEDQQVGGSILMQSPSDTSFSSSNSNSIPEESPDATSRQTLPSITGNADHISNHTPNRTPNRIASSSSTDSISQKPLRRRHTLSHHSRSSDPNTYTETKADIQWALNKVAEEGVVKQDRTGYKEKQITVYHNVSGQIIEATGLKGELDHLELYVKVRLNTRPSYQRQHKFGRGPVVHKTRVLRGSHSPQWMEDFMVKESPIASDSLLTLDLKSGSKVNIGTYAITLDKFFEGNLKATRVFDIGNDVKLRVKISRQLH